MVRGIIEINRSFTQPNLRFNWLMGRYIVTYEKER